MPRKPPTPITTALDVTALVGEQFVDRADTFRCCHCTRSGPTIFEARQVPWYDEDMSDAVAGAILVLSEGVVRRLRERNGRQQTQRPGQAGRWYIWLTYGFSSVQK